MPRLDYVDADGPRPDPATAGVFLDTMWHVTDVELRRTDARDHDAWIDLVLAA